MSGRADSLRKSWETRRSLYGDSGATKPYGITPTPAENRFENLFIPEPNTGCWLWMGCVDAKGYGLFKVSPGKTRRAHIYSYEQQFGKVPKGLVLDHLCRVQGCVNPNHLEPVTNRENIRRGNAGHNMRIKTHCPQGHPYSGENLMINSNGQRICRECYRVRCKQYREKIKNGK